MTNVVWAHLVDPVLVVGEHEFKIKTHETIFEPWRLNAAEELHVHWDEYPEEANRFRRLVLRGQGRAILRVICRELHEDGSEQDHIMEREVEYTYRGEASSVHWIGEDEPGWSAVRNAWPREPMVHLTKKVQR